MPDAGEKIAAFLKRSPHAARSVAGPPTDFFPAAPDIDMSTEHPFARRVFTLAGIYGLLVLLPQYFMEERLGIDYPPPVTHPEHFYGFIGVALAWQFGFLLIARDPQRYRLFMLPAVLEKLSFALPVFVLFAQGRVAGPLVGFAALDVVLAALFLLAFRQCRPAVA